MTSAQAPAPADCQSSHYCSKTEFLLIGLKQQFSKIQGSLTTTHSARNLDFIFDEHLLSDQITALAKSCCYHIRKLRCIRPYLDFATSIVHCMRGGSRIYDMGVQIRSEARRRQ